MFLQSLSTVLYASTVLAKAYVHKTVCNDKTYTYNELAGYGLISGDARDEFGDTIGGIGSSIALERSSWRKLENGSYAGAVWTAPDRGWNTEGTLNYQPRIHKFEFVLIPKPHATKKHPSGDNLFFTYKESIRFYGPDGTPCTGLDADATGHLSYPGFPDLPVSTYTGDGFGGSGRQHQRIPVDPEGLVLASDGTFWISDEYGPYVYHFNLSGVMINAIRPVDAIIPMRNGTESFSSDSPAYYNNHGMGHHVYPPDNPTGRDNNHGFEGLSFAGDESSLYFLLQAACNQEGGLHKQTERYSRLLKYSIADPEHPTYEGEFVVPLPLYEDPTAKKKKNPKSTGMSEIMYVSGSQFLILARDSSVGRFQKNTKSTYRHADVFDISKATNIKGDVFDTFNGSIATDDGVLDPNITPAEYCSFLDFNINSQLKRFGVHNGGKNDTRLLNEKWESLDFVPVDGKDGADGEYFLFTMSDNDFVTQKGRLNDGNFHYKDETGVTLDNQALVFQVSMPIGSTPPRVDL